MRRALRRALWEEDPMGNRRKVDKAGLRALSRNILFSRKRLGSVSSWKLSMTVLDDIARRNLSDFKASFEQSNLSLRCVCLEHIHRKLFSRIHIVVFAHPTKSIPLVPRGFAS
jgi:hypothetical protein